MVVVCKKVYSFLPTIFVFMRTSYLKVMQARINVRNTYLPIILQLECYEDKVTIKIPRELYQNLQE